MQLSVELLTVMCRDFRWWMLKAEAERDEARAWARRMKAERDSESRWASEYFELWEKAQEQADELRAQFNAVMQEVEARNQAEYFATVDNPPPFSPVLEED